MTSVLPPTPGNPPVGTCRTPLRILTCSTKQNMDSDSKGNEEMSALDLKYFLPQTTDRGGRCPQGPLGVAVNLRERGLTLQAHTSLVCFQSTRCQFFSPRPQECARNFDFLRNPVIQLPFVGPALAVLALPAPRQGDLPQASSGHQPQCHLSALPLNTLCHYLTIPPFLPLHSPYSRCPVTPMSSQLLRAKGPILARLVQTLVNFKPPKSAPT